MKNIMCKKLTTNELKSQFEIKGEVIQAEGQEKEFFANSQERGIK